MPTLGKAEVSTALPQPPRTSQKVPMNSAVERWDKDIAVLPFNACECRAAAVLARAPGAARIVHEPRDV